MLSIRDVAKHAGVAISTVSKVLNHYPGISEQTRQRVNAAVKELNFTPNAVASALSSKQSARVALLINMAAHPQVIDEVNMQYMAGAIQKAKELSLDVVTVFFSMIEDMNGEELTAYLRSQSIAGIIVYGMRKTDRVLQQLVNSQTFKAVVVDAPLVNESTSTVTIDHKRAQMDVARKTVADNQAKRILYISGKKDGYVTDRRLEGMKELAEELGLKVLVRCGEFSEQKARELAFTYARSKDAIVCASDLMAIGAMKALIEMDVFRPVCGFDGISLMGYAGKKMNTVRQDFAGISARAVEEIRELMYGGRGREVILGHSLVRMEYKDVIC